MKQFTIISSLFVSLSLLVFASPDYEQRDPPLMPEGFEEIHLGMKWDEMISIRPGAVILNMMPNGKEELRPDPTKPMGGLEEQVTDPTGVFERAVFVFEAGRLVGTMFSSAPLVSKEQRHAFLYKVISTTGMPDKAAIAESDPKQVITTWNTSNKIVNAVFASSEHYGAESSVTLQIITKDFAEKIGAPGASSEKQRPTSDSQSATVKALLNELRMLKMRSDETSRADLHRMTEQEVGARNLGESSKSESQVQEVISTKEKRDRSTVIAVIVGVIASLVLIVVIRYKS